MSLFRRTRQLMVSQLHDWYDRLEDPRKIARQHLRDFESAIAQAQVATARSIAAERMLQRQLADYVRQLALRQSRAEAAMRQGDEQLARDELARQFELKQLTVSFEERLLETRRLNARLRAQLQIMRDRLARTEGTLATNDARLAAATALAATQSSLELGSCCASGFELDHSMATLLRSVLEAEATLELTDVDNISSAHDIAERDAFVSKEIERLRPHGP
jgi:phage shock protein A